MKKRKIGILTLNGNNNFGNKLQNYALKKKLEEYNYEVYTLWFYDNFKERIKAFVKRFVFFKKEYRRENIFEKFTCKYLNRKYYKNSNINTKYDKFVVGSDQVWNYEFKGVRDNFDRFFLNFSPTIKNFSYAASISVENIPENYCKKIKNNLNNLKYISVREESTKRKLEEISNRNDIYTLIDPTMLLSANEWNKLIKVPKQINIKNNKKYILNYFLGELSKERKEMIDKIAKENNCQIINILDKKDPFYISGPEEFLYLEKNAFLICTDSFHASVFSIIFNRPFLVFEREDIKISSMNSRIATLLSKFDLENKKVVDNILPDDYLESNYDGVYEILNKEIKKSEEFLKRALDIE